MKRFLFIICTLIISATSVKFIFGQQKDEYCPVLYDPTPRTVYARHIQLSEEYAEFILEFVNRFVGNVGADKSEDWWHEKGPFLTLEKSDVNPYRYFVIIRKRKYLRDSHYYTYIGKYLLVASNTYFERYVDDGATLKIEYTEFAFLEEPICWCFEEKNDSLQLTEQPSSHLPARVLIK